MKDGDLAANFSSTAQNTAYSSCHRIKQRRHLIKIKK